MPSNMALRGVTRGEIRISGARVNEHLVVRVADDGRD